MNEFQENVYFLSDNYHCQPDIRMLNSKPEIQPHNVFSIKSNVIQITPLLHQRDLENFRRKLIDLMLFSVQSWEFSTNTSKLELAEESGIWKITIDDGRLRTRSLDRYLSLKNLPKKPRWRQVLRTARFVLNECDLDQPSRLVLSEKLQAVVLHLREEALKVR
jgi:hypothetical protein